MRLLLDSNAYSQVMRGWAQIADLVRRSEEILLRPSWFGELIYGFRRGSCFERNAAGIRSFLESPYVFFVPMGLATADRYSRIAVSLRAKVCPIPSNDVSIAADGELVDLFEAARYAGTTSSVTSPDTACKSRTGGGIVLAIFGWKTTLTEYRKCRRDYGKSSSTKSKSKNSENS